MCGPFKKSCLGHQQPQPPSASILDGFYSQKLWGLLLLALDPGLRGPVWDWDSLLLRGDHYSQLFPPDFYLPHVGVGQPILHI